MDDPDHVAKARAVYDHSADEFVATVGTELSPRFEAAVDRAALDAFAEMVLARPPRGGPRHRLRPGPSGCPPHRPS